MMTEAREVDGCVSPSLMFATCKYRWQKTILVDADTVIFVTINNKDIEPIKLEWTEGSGCFFSDELKVPVGSFSGHLVVDGTFYPVEEIDIKHYTFEVDLYLKDASLISTLVSGDTHEEHQAHPQFEVCETVDYEQEVMNGEQETKEKAGNVTPANSPVSTSSQTSIHKMTEQLDKNEGAINLSSKYEQLVRSQMSDKAGDCDTELNLRSNSDFPDLNGRGTPVGEDSVAQYHDSEQSRLSLKHLSHDETDSIKNSLLDDYLGKGNNNTNGSLGIEDVLDKRDSSLIADELGNGQTNDSSYKMESPVLSRHSSRHSSARQTPTVIDNQDRSSSVGSYHSRSSVGRNVLDDLIQDAVLRERKVAAEDSQDEKLTGSLRSRQSSGASNEPTSQVSETLHRTSFGGLTATEEKRSATNGSASPEQIADVLNPSDRHSPIRQEFLSGPPFVPTPPNSAQVTDSANTSQRSTPKELLSSALKLRGSQEKLYTEIKTRVGNDGSAHSSQQGSRPQSVTSEQELSQYYDNMADTRNVLGQTGQRITGICSLPAVGAKRSPLEKRSYTPDNHIRIPVTGPIIKGAYLTNKTPPQSPFSNASSRTITPVNTNTEAEQRQRERIQELEYVITSQQKLLDARDMELSQVRGQLDEVKNKNRQLELELYRQSTTPTLGQKNAEMEERLQDITDECHILRRQVKQLQDELEIKENGLNTYNPNSPDALKRKITELNGQIQDLQEAHETTVAELNASEARVKELARESETLRITQSDRVRQMEDDNRFYKAEIKRLKETPSVHNEATDYRLKIELQQLKEDNRSLRERNYRLHDENIKQKEDLSELRKLIGSGDSLKRTPTGRKTPSETWKGDLSWEKTQTSQDYSRSQPSEYQTERQGFTTKQTSSLLDTNPADFRTDRYRRKLSGLEEWSDDKYKSYTQSLSMERPKPISQSQYTISDRGRHERKRTQSTEKEFKTSSLTGYGADLSDQQFTKSKGYKHLESSYQDDGNTSDTPTDILCGVQTTEKPLPMSWGNTRPRSGSVGSDDSNGSFSDTEERIRETVRRRSKSADGRDMMKWKLQTFPGALTTKRDGKLSPPPTGGLRSISPRPLVTQHNKTGLSLSSSLNSLTQGLRPFAPRSAADLQIHDVIKFSRQGGKLSQGVIKFIGHLPGRGDIYLGVELDKEDGKHDGTFEGIRYFKSKPNKGVFVAYNKVVMAWTSQ